MDQETNEKGRAQSNELAERAAERRLFYPILALGVAALFFGSYHVYNALQTPFRPDARKNISLLNSSGSTIAALSKKDTDNDGLSDFDELYTYHTSPYLADSDGDGKNDKQEVSAGTDPNCPGTQTCSPIAQIGGGTSNTNTEPLTNVPGSVNSVDTTNASAGLPQGLTLNDLRTALKNAGAPAATVDSLDDQTLFDAYQEVANSGGLASTNTNGTATVNTNSTNTSALKNNASSNSIDIATLKSFTPDQIRQFLIQGGADAATVNGADDATLTTVFQNSLQELNTTGQ